jgi:hypothetical protein
MSPLVSICIIQYGSNDHLKKCIESIKNSSYSDSDMEIIIIDNNEHDNNLFDISNMNLGNSQKTYIKNRTNVGFAEGCNQGIRSAKGKYVFILNNDIEIERDCIRYLVDFAEAHPDVAVLQPKMLDYANRYTFHSSAAGGFIDILGYPFARGRIFDIVEQDMGQYDDVVEIFWASGAALFAKKEILEESGFFDSDFFLYMEEIDLEWRIQLLGYKIVYIPTAKIYHIGCPHLGRENFYRMYYTHRNSIIMLIKNLSLGNLIIFLPLRIGLEIITLLFSLASLKIIRFFAVLNAFIYILIHLPSILHKRLKTQSMRKTKDVHLLSNAYYGSVALHYFFRKGININDLKKFKVTTYVPQRR